MARTYLGLIDSKSINRLNNLWAVLIYRSGTAHLIERTYGRINQKGGFALMSPPTY